MAQVTLHNLVKKFSEEVVAVNSVNLDIQDKEFVVLVGPSGCGKTTTLRMVAGLEDISAGEIYIGDRLVNDVPPKDRNIAMVFQNYALYPHMTVYKNMAFSLKLRRTSKSEIERRVKAAADILGLATCSSASRSSSPVVSGSVSQWGGRLSGSRKSSSLTSR